MRNKKKSGTNVNQNCKIKSFVRIEMKIIPKKKTIFLI